MAKQPNYEAWNWDYRAFPKTSSTREKIAFFVKAGILAPSLHNTQPWNFTINKNTLTIHPDWTRQLKHTDPTGRHLLLGIGCCIANIEVAAARWDYAVTIHVTNVAKKPVIRLLFNITSKPNPDLSRLAPYITKRYSNKLLYSPAPLPSTILTALSRMQNGQSRVFVTHNPMSIHKSAVLQQEAVTNEASHPLFGRELGQWLKLNNSKAFDGMPGFVVGLPPPASVAGKLLIPRLRAISTILGKKDYEALYNCPAIGVIAVTGNTTVSSLSAGRLYERVTLYLTSHNISCTPMHSITYYPKAHEFLASTFHFHNMNARFFFRMGYSETSPYHTPRRPVEHVIEPTNTEQALREIIQTPIATRHMNIDNHVINYAIAGKGKPLLLIHGGNIGWGQWYPNIQELAKHFLVYAIDLPGAGRSSHIDFASMDLQKDLVDVVDAFVQKLNITKPHIVGSSIGGWTAINVSLKHPELIDKLVLVDAIGFTNRLKIPDRIMGIHAFARIMAKTMLNPVRSNKNVEMFMRDVFHNPKFPFPQEFIEYFYETMKTSHNLLFISRLSGFTGIPKELDMADALPRLSNKTLVLWGKYDKLTSPDIVQPVVRRIPHSRFVIIPDAGHIPSIEQSEQFNKLVISFLDT